MVFQRSTYLFHDGMAWLSQITMFVVLGLLVNPEALLDVWMEGLLVAVVLTLVARPLAVAPMLALFGFNAREITLVSWVGLRGSVPIILAIFPLVFDLPGAALIFNVVFFVVLISATVQGATLPIVARKLGLTEMPPAKPAATLEITALNDVNAEIVEYTLGENPRAAGRLLSQIALPDSTVVAMITRDSEVIPPRGSTRLIAGDHLFVVLRPEVRPFVDTVFSQSVTSSQTELPHFELKLKASTRLADVYNSYGIYLGEEKDLTLEQLIKARLDQPVPEIGAELLAEGIRLRICDTIASRITTVGLTPPPASPPEPEAL
jgi:cell volume regulation protein A